MMMALADFFHQLHFIRPQWLWAILPLTLLIGLLWRYRHSYSGWDQHVSPALLSRVLVQRPGGRYQVVTLLAAGWLLAVIALAGPGWRQAPVPLLQLPAARVLVLDMSLSMYAGDISPSRLERLRFKLLDLLQMWPGGETGLVVFARDAYVISPLSSDSNNLAALLPAISPEIMPASGSAPQAGVRQAIALLRSAGYQQGEVWLLTDGVTESQGEQITTQLQAAGYQLRLLAVGTPAGAPARLSDGSLLRDQNGQVVSPALPLRALRSLAEANGQPLTIMMQSGNQDLERLLALSGLPWSEQTRSNGEADTYLTEQWQDDGVYLVILLLPLMLFAFRRGALLMLSGLLLLPPPSPALASDWSALWSVRNQQQRAHLAFEQQDYQQAGELFTASEWLGSTYYRQGQFQRALDAFSRSDTAESWYNRGNALARLEQYEDAIAAYQEALNRQPALTPAIRNKSLLEQFLRNQTASGQQQQPSAAASDLQAAAQPGKPGASSQASAAGGETGPPDVQPGQPAQSATSEATAQPLSTKQPQVQQSGEDSVSQAAQRTDQPSAEPEAAQNQSQQQKKDNPAADLQPSEQTGTDTPAATASETDSGILTEHAGLQRWLEQINDDPGILLRNKMLLDAQRRAQNELSVQGEIQPW